MSSDTKKDRENERAKRAEEHARASGERAEARARESEERAQAKEDRAEARARVKVEEAEDRVRAHSERAQEKVTQALERVARAEDQAGQKVAEALDRAERAAGEAPAAEEIEPLIWFRQEPASRRPAHTRADIARAAVEIADSEGFDAVSMRRVAQRLGAGTMTLYHYVRNKDELITLMSDAVMADVVVPPGELPDDWRGALTVIAKRTHAAFAAHHWVFQQMSDANPGPNGMRHFEQSLQAVAPLGLDKEQTFEVIGQVDDYVFGYALREVQEAEEHERGWGSEVEDFFHREVATGRYPRIDEFFGDDLEASFDSIVEFMSRPDRFDRSLDRLLDGIEAEFAPRK